MLVHAWWSRTDRGRMPWSVFSGLVANCCRVGGARCGMSADRGLLPPVDPEDVSSNPSDNPAFKDVVAARLSRRAVLRTGSVMAAAGFLAGADPLGGTRPADAAVAASGRARSSRPLLGFTPVAPSSADAFT